MRHSAFFSSAQAHRRPWPSKHSPLARPAGWRNVDSLPSTLHSKMRSLGWSVKNTLPFASQAGPSVNANPSASFCNCAPGAAMGGGGSESRICSEQSRKQPSR